MKRLLLAVMMVLCATVAQAQTEQLRLNWTDNASNEDGTKIERGSTSSGPFSQIFLLQGANLVTFTDNNLAPATSFCYRVRAFNAGGDSPYSNVACAVTPATMTVTVNGAGTVTSSPVGISCPGTCSVKFDGKSTVMLTAAAAVGSTFTGWAGGCTGAAATCSVTMDGVKSVTATFTAIAVPAAPSNLTTTPISQ